MVDGVDNVIGLNRSGTPRDLMLADLANSGLTPEDISARNLEGPERAATRTPASVSGYVIPYHDIFGKALPHYRVRLFDSDVKYRQPKDSPNHVYFPRGFLRLAKTGGIVYLTEGEKKAALACKLGFPTVALGGVDTWRNRIIQLPGEAELEQKGQKNKVLQAKISAGEEVSEDHTSSLATGMQDLADYLLQSDSTLIIVFDTDKVTGVKPQVQRAAATLGFQLRGMGVPFQKIRQMILPWDKIEHEHHEEKMGLDDYLMADSGPESFEWLAKRLLERRSAFPRHPSIVDYIGKRLQKSRMSRSESKNVALAILAELDSLGIRLRSNDEKQMYYFDFKSRRLMKAGFLYGQTDEGHETPFGGFLYQRFGISAADQRALVWLSAQFNGEDPIEDVTPERVIARPVLSADSVHYQINDGQYCTVDVDGLSIKDNGADGILFEAGHVRAIDPKELAIEYRRRTREPLPVKNWWYSVLSEVRLRDHNETQALFSLLYYISPWLNRWRGTQLPVELVLGESGSGKSTLSELRLDIISGDPRLRNSPQDIKDWHASITNTGGLHVTDNVQLIDRSLRQRLSDELCRIVTEPHPVVEMRRLYSNAELVRFPIRSVFAITAIRQPFQNADILQRAVILELDKPADPTQGAVMYDMDWTKRQLQTRGGRTAWVAHHLHVLHLFFGHAQKMWDPHYRAKHRLINLEQTLILMAEVFGDKEARRWIPNYLNGILEDSVGDTDDVFQAIKEYIDMWKQGNPNHGHNGPYFLAADIKEWAESEPDYKDNTIISNSRKLGRWIQEHKSMLASILGIMEAGTINNRARYKVIPIKKRGHDNAV